MVSCLLSDSPTKSSSFFALTCPYFWATILCTVIYIGFSLSRCASYQELVTNPAKPIFATGLLQGGWLFFLFCLKPTKKDPSKQPNRRFFLYPCVKALCFKRRMPTLRRNSYCFENRRFLSPLERKVSNPPAAHFIYSDFPGLLRILLTWAK